MNSRNRGRGRNRKNNCDRNINRNLSAEQQRRLPCRSFCKGEEVGDTQISLNYQHSSRYQHKMATSTNDVRDENLDQDQSRYVPSYPTSTSFNNNFQQSYQRSESVPFTSNYGDDHYSSVNDWGPQSDVYPSQNQNSNRATSFQRNSSVDHEEEENFLKAKNDFYQLLKRKKPNELKSEYRRKVENLSRVSVEKNLKQIDEHCALPAAHLKNLHRQREVFEDYINNVKQKLALLSSSDRFEIVQKADSILESVKSECTLFDRCLPGYSLRSGLFSKLKENQIIIISSDSSYYLNIVLPILLKKEYSHHLLLSCETNPILSSGIKMNVTNLYPIDDEEPEQLGINFFTAKEMLTFLKDFEISSSQRDFISVCKLPLKRSIIVDLMLARLRDVLEDHSESKLVLLLSSFDKSLKYENYFSDFNVDIITTPKLTFPVKTVWKNVPLLPLDDYIEEVIKTILSIHVCNEPGNVMVFLPSIADAKSTLVGLQKKMAIFCFNDIEFILLHEKSTQIEWLNMCIKLSNKRHVFLVTDCAESFVLPISYVIDCGLRNEHVYDPSKKLDVLTTSFISCDKAKLRKNLAGIYNAGICYRLYSKENYCNEMLACEYPEMLTINPFNVMMKLFQYQPNCATKLEFVESLSYDAKDRALNLLKKTNSIKDDKLTFLGEKIIKLPFIPMHSKLISLGIEWELGYEAVIIVAFFSVKGRVFQYNNNSEDQRKIDAVKLQLIQDDSDTLTFLYIYKLFLENNESSEWCHRFFINYETLKLVHIKVNEICGIVGETLKKNIAQKFNKTNEATNSLLDLLLDCYRMHLCVFTGHYKSGYRMLSSRSIAFLHPSSLTCLTNEMPQFIVFDHMISNKRDFLVNITAIPHDSVMTALTDQTLNYDYSDMFESNLVEKVIEPVGEKVIREVLIGKRGQKLKEIEQKIKNILSDESIVIEPSVEKGRITVFATKHCIDNAVQCVEKIIKNEFSKILDCEETHVLPLVKGHVTVPIELKWVKGAKVKSFKLISQYATNSISKVPTESEEISYAVKKSIHVVWIRRKCSGKAIIEFIPEHFTQVRRYAMRFVPLFGADVLASIEDNSKQYSLTLHDIPADVTSDDIERELKKNVFGGIDFKTIELKYEPPFETSQQLLHDVKDLIEDACNKYTELIDYKILVQPPKPTATKMTAFINVLEDENIEPAILSLSNNLKNLVGIKCIPVYSSLIQCSLKVCEPLLPCFKEKLGELQQMVKEQYGNIPFKFDVIPLNDSGMGRIKMSANHLEVLHLLQRTISSLLEGDILNNNFSRDFFKLFCHAGLLLLKTLEKSCGVHIISDNRTKSLRLYGPPKKCHQVKQQILQFILDCEHEVAKEINLIKLNNNRILLKALLVKYGVNLENFIISCKLRLAVLNIKSCSLSLHGSQESIDLAETILENLASSFDLDNISNILDNNVESCPVCACPAGNPYRLEICGHLYCRECIKALVDQAQIPIKCCFEECNKDLILDDISKVIELGSEPDDDHKKLNILLEKSLKKYLEEHQAEFIYCPAPDCSMFFNRKDVTVSKHTCPLCLSEICIECNVVYHQGFSCDMYQGSKNDPDYSFKIYQQNSAECKRCPKCKTAIEKDGGCDHMTCKTCNSHFCWVCVQEFPTADAVYEHIPFCSQHPRW